jgi:cytidylate kinase
MNITVSGALASGAREVAQAVAHELSLDYVDQEILVEAARRLGVQVSEVEQNDERRSTLGERLAGVMRTLIERSAAAGAADPSGGGAGIEMVLARTYGEAAELAGAPGGPLDDERYLATLTSVMQGIAARGNVVILGRGGQAILHDEPQTLHVYVAAPLAWRVGNLVERQGVAKAEAEKRIKQSDQNRQAFHRHYFKVDADSPQLYDLGINASRIGIPVAARMVSVAAKELEPRPG